MAMFVTLDQAKRRLRLPAGGDDVDLQDLIDQAEAHVIGWCSKTARSKAVADAWDPASVPKEVVAAILVQTVELDRFRGDDVEPPPRQEGEELAVTVRELLRAYHDPGVA